MANFPAPFFFSLSRIAVALILLTAATIAVAAAPAKLAPKSIEPFTATYQLLRGDLPVAEVKRALKKLPDGRFQYESTSRGIGLAAMFVKDVITEESQWRFGPLGQLQPLDYHYARIGGKREHRVSASFDWRSGVIHSQVDSETTRVSIPKRSQDKLLYQLALMFDLRAGATNFEYDVIDDGEIKTYKFEKIGEKEITTKLGALHTIGLQWARNNRTTTVWCAPALQFLPVQISQTEKSGETLDLILTAVDGLSHTDK